MTTAIATAEKLHEHYRLLSRIQNPSEADTIAQLIDPVLEYLEFPTTQQSRENQANGNRPDIILWNKPFACVRPNEPAQAILEAKPLGHDLDGQGRARTERPKQQLNRYLNGDSRSAPGTIGILTDGRIWHIVRNDAHEKHTPLVGEFQMFGGSQQETAAIIEEIQRSIIANGPQSTNTRFNRRNQNAVEICAAITAGKELAEILKLLVGERNALSALPRTATTSSRAAQAERDYWDSYAYAAAGNIRVTQPTLHGTPSMAVAVVRTKADDDPRLYREDVAIAATTFAKTTATDTSVVLMIQPNPDGIPNTVRLAVHHQGHAGMTTEFNPHTPAPQTLKTIQQVYKRINSATAIDAQDIAKEVAARGVRKEFYDRVTKWTLRQQRKAIGTPKQRHAYREAVLRHLIRTIFVWILKEEGKLPPQAFDEAFAKRQADGQYHESILTFLFHERLNQPANARKIHENQKIQAALAKTRFLNGSLFARHQNDGTLKLNDADYFGNDAEHPGLFTIFNDYDWTASEHTPQSSEQTIDPEVLSNLFENLIAATVYGEETPDRMPNGVYYTPADVATEMVKDALAEAVINQAPETWTRRDLRQLFSNTDEPAPVMPAPEKKRLIERIRELTIYDPATGSGEFPFLVTLSIRSALTKLGMEDGNAVVTRDIIARQLFAQDINPMAIQVARLRLFIAIIAAENEPIAWHQQPPLPNLEAKIVCADTTATIADPNWSPFRARTLEPIQDGIKAAMEHVAEIRKEWQSAHDETTKTTLRQRDTDARKRLRQAVKGKMANPEIAAFADYPLLAVDPKPATTDPRLLFYQPSRGGFDIIIGNPPYEGIYADLRPIPGATPSERDKLAQASRSRRDHLTLQNQYTTVAGGDLYNLIAEASLALAKPENSVITLIVPLSLCFSQAQERTRKLFEKRCQRISLRCHDNRPDKIFHNSPVANAESRVRTTIITAFTGTERPVIELSATMRWRKNERPELLATRPTTVTKRQRRNIHSNIDSQWERVATSEIRELIDAMGASKKKIRDMATRKGGNAKIAFPNTAMYFITVTPSSSLQRIEYEIPVGDQENLDLAIAAANTHAAYAWWQAYGDAFNVNRYQISTIAIPGKWLDDRSFNNKVRQLAQELLNAISPANVDAVTTGLNSTVQDSLNFHDCASDTIAELDELYVEALGLPQHPLLEQLRTLRSPSNWRLGAA